MAVGRGVFDGRTVEVGTGVRVGVEVPEGVGVKEGVLVDVGVSVSVAVGVNDNAAMASCASAVRAIEVNVEFTVLVGEGVLLVVGVCVGGMV